jgi:hypothetical protein
MAFADAPENFAEDAILVCLRVHAIAKFQEAAGVRGSWRVEKTAIEIAQMGSLRSSGQLVSLCAGIKEFQKYVPRFKSSYPCLWRTVCDGFLRIRYWDAEIKIAQAW